MIDFFDARAFALGMVALINPCGFALLPAYLGYFLGLDDKQSSVIKALTRSQKVGLSLSAGFLTVFGVLGLFLAGTITGLQESGWLPRATVVIGVGLLILGGFMLAGFQPLVKLPKLNKGGKDQSIFSIYLFGVSYAIASLTCTIGIFLSTIGTSTSGASFSSKFGAFLSYGIGMGLLATFLTLAVGLGKKSLVNSFKKALPYINPISAVILIAVGFYVVLYGIWSEQVLDFNTVPTPWINSIVVGVENWQASFANWFNAQVVIGDFSSSRTTVLGWSFLAVNLIVAASGLGQRLITPSE